MRLLFSCVSLEGHFRPLLPLARALVTARARGDVRDRSGREERPLAVGFAHIAAGLTEHEARAARRRGRAEVASLPVARARRPFGFAGSSGSSMPRAKLRGLLELAALAAGGRDRPRERAIWRPRSRRGVGLPSVNHSFGAMVPLSILVLAAELVEPLWRGAGLEPEPYAGAFRGLFVDISPPCFTWERPVGKSIRLRPVEPEPASRRRGSRSSDGHSSTSRSARSSTSRRSSGRSSTASPSSRRPLVTTAGTSIRLARARPGAHSCRALRPAGAGAATLRGGGHARRLRDHARRARPRAAARARPAGRRPIRQRGPCGGAGAAIVTAAGRGDAGGGASRAPAAPRRARRSAPARRRSRPRSRRCRAGRGRPARSRSTLGRQLG